MVPADFPSNVQFRAHFKEFLVYGYKVSSEAVQVKFTQADASRTLEEWSVRFVDGFTKVLLMLGVVAIVSELKLSEEQLQDPVLKSTLTSFGQVRCAYQHYEHASMHFLNSLRHIV